MPSFSRHLLYLYLVLLHPEELKASVYVLFQMLSSSEQVIAGLTPANYEAKCAYNDVATRTTDSTPNTNEFLHASRFMVIKPHMREQTEIHVAVASEEGANGTGIDTQSEAGDTGADTETETGGHHMLPPDLLRFEGYCELSFGTRPTIARLGWFIGIGRWNAKIQVQRWSRPSAGTT
jgi:hypothetical protein